MKAKMPQMPVKNAAQAAATRENRGQFLTLGLHFSSYQRLQAFLSRFIGGLHVKRTAAILILSRIWAVHSLAAGIGHFLIPCSWCSDHRYFGIFNGYTVPTFKMRTIARIGIYLFSIGQHSHLHSCWNSLDNFILPHGGEIYNAA